jgi:hypothetical protein
LTLCITIDNPTQMEKWDFHCGVLGVPQDAPLSEIKKAYRDIAKLIHPDRHQGSNLAKERFQQLKSSYDYLLTNFTAHLDKISRVRSSSYSPHSNHSGSETGPNQCPKDEYGDSELRSKKHKPSRQTSFWATIRPYSYYAAILIFAIAMGSLKSRGRAIQNSEPSVFELEHLLRKAGIPTRLHAKNSAPARYFVQIKKLRGVENNLVRTFAGTECSLEGKSRLVCSKVSRGGFMEELSIRDGDILCGVNGRSSSMVQDFLALTVGLGLGTVERFALCVEHAGTREHRQYVVL